MHIVYASYYVFRMSYYDATRPFFKFLGSFMDL
jgi:hypothetical protein